MIRIIVAVHFLFLSASLMAQELESELLFYGDVMTYAFEDENRMRAANEFTELLMTYLGKDPMLEKEADFKKYLIVLDLDEGRKLISWKARLKAHEYRYGCYLLEKGKDPKRFTRTEALTADMAFMTSTADDWYGCQYYNFKKMSKDKYLILGIDPTSEYDNQKIADVLIFNKDGSITLGGPHFEDKESPGTYANRIIISYSSDAAVTFNYNPQLDILIKDHLESRLGMQAGQGATNIPDGTYEGYKLEKDKWMYVEKIFDHVYETAPIPKPTQSGLFKGK